MSSLAFVVIFTLAVFRVTHLITSDSFPPIQWARNKLIDSKAPESLRYLAQCVWCSSVWVAAFGVLFLTPGLAIRERILLLFAASAVAGLAESWVDG